MEVKLHTFQTSSAKRAVYVPRNVHIHGQKDARNPVPSRRKRMNLKQK
jgi:hypothetical protein